VNTKIIGCGIEAPSVKIIHGGVLAMRVRFDPKTFSQKTSLFKISIWLTAKSEYFLLKIPRNYRLKEIAPCTTIGL